MSTTDDSEEDVGCRHGVRVFECEVCYSLTGGTWPDRIDTNDESECEEW
jgi:hypothetical protein